MVKELFGLQTSLGSDKFLRATCQEPQLEEVGDGGVESESRASLARLGGFLETIRYFSFILRLY